MIKKSVEYLRSVKTDDTVRAACRIVVEWHCDRLRTDRQPFLLGVRVDLENVHSSRKYRLLA